jgi:16S rRNA (cytosine967-C5)-methyltransferase
MLTPSRQIAFQVLLRVEREASFAAELLNSRLAEKLSAPDRALAQEIVMGCLRRQNQLDWLAAHFSGRAPERWDAEVRVAVRMGIYQLRYLERVPASAAVDQSVEAVKRARKASAAGLVNAVLRRVTREPLERLFPAEMGPAERCTIRLCHPGWLLERWERRYGAERAEAIARLNNEPPPVFIRVPPGARVEMGRPCRYLRDCREITGVAPGAAAGYPAQDQASQIVPHLVAAGPGQRVLDLCAAPGLKSAALLDLAAGLSLIACDVHPGRLRLMRRLAGAGVQRLRLVALDGTRPLPFAVAFDRILLDAPCSGTGTIRRNPEIKWRLQEDDLPILAAKQRWLLSNALDSLAPGGRLVYSTCSIEHEENQAVVQAVLEGRGEFRLLELERLPAEFLTDEGQTLLRGRWFQTLPDLGLDGFFGAVIERT